MKVVARHVIGNLFECNEEILKDEIKLLNIIKEAVKISNSKLISLFSHKFEWFQSILIQNINLH